MSLIQIITNMILDRDKNIYHFRVVWTGHELLCCKSYFIIIFAETFGFHIIFGSLKRCSQLHWCCHYRLFCFKIRFLFFNTSIGALITYDITQLISFIKFVHQIIHCHTALPQMCLFFVTDLSQIFSIFKILVQR